MTGYWSFSGLYGRGPGIVVPFAVAVIGNSEVEHKQFSLFGSI